MIQAFGSNNFRVPYGLLYPYSPSPTPVIILNVYMFENTAHQAQKMISYICKNPMIDISSVSIKPIML